MINHSRHLAFGLVAVILFAAQARADNWTFNGVSRTVAVADVHGAFGAMVETLQKSGVIGSGSEWTGGETNLVIVGDIVDRGPDSRAAMDLLMRLEDEAAKAGGRVHVLIGNHEAMNLTGDLRYVDKAEFTAFADDENATERDFWFKAFEERRAPGNVDSGELRAKFDESFPAGFFAHRRAFAADGKYGKWLLTKPVIIVIDGTAFVHGGLPPMISEVGLDGVNGKLHRDLTDYVRQLEFLTESGVMLPTDSFHDQPDVLRNYMPAPATDISVIEAVEAAKELNESAIFSTDGPTWYRGNVSCSPLIETDRLDAALRAIAAQRVVIGHTVTPTRQVLQRLDGRVIEIDTGMTEYYKGVGSALIISDDRMVFVNQAADELSAPMPHPRRVGMRPGGFLEVEALELLLAQGAVIKVTQDVSGRTLATVSDGERTVDAVFSKRAGRGFFPEVAAYRLDRLLGLDMVPVSVKRDVDGVEGSLQFQPRSYLDELQRQETGAGAQAQCALPDQWNAMFVFDALTHNSGRNLQAIHYSRDNWQLILVHHGKAFAARKGRPAHLQSVQISLSQAWKSTLASLDDEQLAATLGDVLDKKRLRALAARKDELLAL